MKTDCELWNEHRGHELKVEGKKFPETISIREGFSPTGTGVFRCPKCRIKEVVERTRKICEHHRYGEHIDIVCEECGAVGNTKNIGHIGNRTLFINCGHVRFVHRCEALGEKERR